MITLRRWRGGARPYRVSPLASYEEDPMTISVHPVVDQLVQWWDGYACLNDLQYLEIHPDARYHYVLAALEKPMCLNRSTQNSGVELWDPPELAYVKNFENIRRTDFSASSVTRRALMKRFASQIRPSDNMGAVAKCWGTLGLTFRPFILGYLTIVGWDHMGRLECKFTRRGSAKYNEPLEETFYSPIGLTETARLCSNIIDIKLFLAED